MKIKLLLGLYILTILLNGCGSPVADISSHVSYFYPVYSVCNVSELNLVEGCTILVDDNLSVTEHVIDSMAFCDSRCSDCRKESFPSFFCDSDACIIFYEDSSCEKWRIEEAMKVEG